MSMMALERATSASTFEPVEPINYSMEQSGPVFDGDILQKITQLYIKMQELIGLIETDSEGMDENLVKAIRASYENKINQIRFQAWTKLGTSLAGGICSIGSGAVPGLLGKCTDWSKASLNQTGKVLDGLGRAIPQFGDVGSTIGRGRETGADSDIGVTNHRMDRVGTVQKNNNSIQDRIHNLFGQIQNDYFNLFRVAR